MITATTVNKPEIHTAPKAGRTGGIDALVASFGILGSSLWISHTGLVGVFKAGELAGVMTLLLVCLSYLQWKTMGRARATRQAEGSDSARAIMVAAQAAFLFVVETVLNTIGVVILAARANADWGSGFMLAFAIAIAAGIAWLNLTVKFVSCERLETRAAPAITVTVDHEPPPAAREPNVYDLDDMRRARELASSEERAGLRTIIAAQAALRAEAWEKINAAKDPVTGQWRKAEKIPAPRKRKRA